MTQLNLLDWRKSPQWTVKGPPKHGDVAQMWHGLHPDRHAWYWFDSRETVWRCIDPFDQMEINNSDTPPRVDDWGHLL